MHFTNYYYYIYITLVGGVSRELGYQRVQGMGRDKQTLVGGVNRELHFQRVQGMRREQ